MASRSTIGGSCPLQFVVHPLPGSPEQLTDRLREVGNRLRLPLNARPGPIVPAISGPAQSVTAVQIVVGPSHFAFLLSDGRLCRLPFSVISDRLDLNKNSQNPGSSGSGGTLGPSHGGSSKSSGGSKSSSHASLSSGESFSRSELNDIHAQMIKFLL